MAKKANIENQSIISEMFTPAELAELKFTPEEINILEGAEAMNRALTIMPSTEKEMDAFFDRIDREFPDGKSFSEIFGHYQELMKTDPEFIGQIVTMSILADEVEVVPPPKSEKVSLDEIKNIKVSDSQKKKIAEINAVLKKMK